MVHVRFFAAAAEQAGGPEQHRDEQTLGALLTALAVEHPGLGAILPRCAILVDGSRSDDDAAPLGADATVDVLPPFAGG